MTEDRSFLFDWRTQGTDMQHWIVATEESKLSRIKIVMSINLFK